MENLITAAQEMNELIACFVKEYNESWYTCRNYTIRLLLDKADTMDLHHKNANIANVVGSSVAIGGGSVAAVGTTLIPFTLGLSVAFIGVGTAIGAAGGLTGAGATAIDHMFRAITRSAVKKKLEEDKSSTTRIQEILQQMLKCAENIEGLQQHILKIFNPEQAVTLPSSDLVCGLAAPPTGLQTISDHLLELIQILPTDILEEFGIRLPKLNDSVKRTIQLLSKILPFAARLKLWLQASRSIGMVAAGGSVIFLSAITILLELGVLIYTIHDMVENKSKTSDAAKLREAVQKLIEEKEEMDEIYKIIQEFSHH